MALTVSQVKNNPQLKKTIVRRGDNSLQSILQRNRGSNTKIKETHFAQDGKTKTYEFNFDKNGTQTIRTDFRADGTTAQMWDWNRIVGKWIPRTSVSENGQMAARLCYI